VVKLTSQCRLKFFSPISQHLHQSTRFPKATNFEHIKAIAALGEFILELLTYIEQAFRKCRL